MIDRPVTLRPPFATTWSSLPTAFYGELAALMSRIAEWTVKPTHSIEGGAS